MSNFSFKFVLFPINLPRRFLKKTQYFAYKKALPILTHHKQLLSRTAIHLKHIAQ